jgi:hypothetical protein
MKHRYLFDVDLAREIVQDGRESVEVDDESVEFSVRTSVIHREHVKHVNPEYAGIISHIWYPTPEGEVIAGHLLIDGHHRAARCLELGRPFLAYLLTEEESRRILLRSPETETKVKTEAEVEAVA